MVTKAFFQNIRQQLLEEISGAKSQIVVAVAWFTDKKLFSMLITKCKEGLDVQLMIADDDINSQYGPDFSELTKAGGTLITVSAADPETLMHNKFCIIDGKTIITGSYNWSKKAVQNHENITITWNYPGLAAQFLTEFDKLKQKYKQQSGRSKKDFDFTKVKHRLQMIQSLIQLEEFQEVPLQLERLNEFELILEVEEILIKIRLCEYTAAITAIDEFQKRYSQIISVDADRISSLRLELIYLQTELLSLQEYHDSLDKEIVELHRHIHIRLGELILELLDLKTLWNQVKEKLGKKSHFEDLKEQYRQFADQLHEAKTKPHIELSEEEQESIKELYRRGVRLCHPDRVEEQFKEKAQEIFIRLKKAFDQNNLREVKNIVHSLEMGVWDLGDEKQEVKEVEKLESLVHGFKLKVVELRRKIDLLTQDEDYRDKMQYGNLEVFLAAREVSLKREIVVYQTKIANHNYEQSTTAK